MRFFPVTIFVIGLLAFTPQEQIPEGWFKAGNNPDKYKMGLDKQTFHIAPNSAFIESTDSKIKGFGTLMQTCSAENYLGKKIKMTGYVKSENVADWAGLWLRVDEVNGTKVKELSFDNMGNRRIKGTTDWTKYEIVLDVPSNSSTLNFGALLDGKGKIWFDSITFEEVPNNTKNTSPYKSDLTYRNKRHLTWNLNSPFNTNFDK